MKFLISVINLQISFSLGSCFCCNKLQQIQVSSNTVLLSHNFSMHRNTLKFLKDQEVNIFQKECFYVHHNLPSDLRRCVFVPQAKPKPTTPGSPEVSLHCGINTESRSSSKSHQCHSSQSYYLNYPRFRMKSWISFILGQIFFPSVNVWSSRNMWFAPKYS